MTKYNYKLIITNDEGEKLVEVTTLTFEMLEEFIGQWERVENEKNK